MVSKPSMPQDRLLVSNVSNTGCRLNWKAPKDDGGLPVKYVIEKFVAQADSWAVHVSTTSQLNPLYAFNISAKYVVYDRTD